MPNSLQAELTAIREHAAIAPLDDRAFLRITGSDATRWLNGMVTNSIQGLTPGEGNYNFLLNAQGRIQGDCTIYREYREPESGDSRFLLQTDASQLPQIEQVLDKFIIMDDVELSKLLEIRGKLVPAETLKGFALTGEKAGEMFATGMGDFGYEFLLVDAPEPGSLVWGTHEDRIILTPPHKRNTFEVWASSADLDALLSAFEKLGAIQISPKAIEAFRILSGTPKFGTDIRDRDLPQETNQPHALHFAKGCYLGQEIVERIRSRGQVHRLFTTFRLEGEMPTLPAPLEANGKPAGELTSAALVHLPEGPALLALGYARREALDTHQTLTYAGGTAIPRTP